MAENHDETAAGAFFGWKKRDDECVRGWWAKAAHVVKL